MKHVDLSYTQLKALAASKMLLLQYKEVEDSYEVFAIERNSLCWTTRVMKDGGADVVDFESTLKANCNKPLEGRPAIDKPPRVSPTSQPIGTTQYWKGYQVVIPAGETSASTDIVFGEDVYVKGGQLYAGSSLDSADRLDVSILLKANDMVVAPNLIDDIYIVSDMKLNFESPECMLLPVSCKLRATITSPNGASTTTARIVNVVITYFY